MDNQNKFIEALEQAMPIDGLLKPQNANAALSNTLGNLGIDRHGEIKPDDLFSAFPNSKKYYSDEVVLVDNKSILKYINKNLAKSIPAENNPEHNNIAEQMRANASSPEKYQRWEYYATTPLSELYANAKENSSKPDPTYDDLLKSVMKNEGGGAGENVGDGHITSWGLTKANYNEKVLGKKFEALTKEDAQNYVRRTLGTRMSEDFLSTIESPALAFAMLEQLHNSGSGARRLAKVLNSTLGLTGDDEIKPSKLDRRTINGELAKKINEYGADEMYFKWVEDIRNNYLYNQNKRARYVNRNGQTVRNSADFIDGWMNRVLFRNPYAIKKDYKKTIKRELKPISKAGIEQASTLEALGLGIFPRNSNVSLSKILTGG